MNSEVLYLRSFRSDTVPSSDLSLVATLGSAIGAVENTMEDDRDLPRASAY